ncbi:MAG TPA: YceI family protein [Rariglobus sp.]|nr:YceI family protein [Rariglobus sp.]
MKLTSSVASFLVLMAASARLCAVPEPLVIDPAQSRVEIVVKATVDSFTGKLEAYKAAVAVEGGHIATASFRFNCSAIRTGKEGRDEAMNDWLETTKYPEGVFTLASFEPAAEGHFKACGILMLHGVSHEIVFPVSVIMDRKVYAIDGEAPLDTRDFGLPVIRKFGLLKVDPLVKVRFHLQGAVKAP